MDRWDSCYSNNTGAGSKMAKGVVRIKSKPKRNRRSKKSSISQEKVFMVADAIMKMMTSSNEN